MENKQTLTERNQMNENLKAELEYKDAGGDFTYPGKVSVEDENTIKQMVEVLSHERFNHDGWNDYSFYKTDACHFLLKLIRKEYK
jgi:hypothetical protein